VVKAADGRLVTLRRTPPPNLVPQTLVYTTQWKPQGLSISARLAPSYCRPTCQNLGLDQISLAVSCHTSNYVAGSEKGRYQRGGSRRVRSTMFVLEVG
jgi:hypothetical protein